MLNPRIWDREKLKRPVSLHYRNVTLEDAIKDFAGKFDDNVLVDLRSLKDVGLDLETPVTVRARELPAGAALRRMLRELDLDFRVDGEAVVIATPEALEPLLEIKLHSMRGLLVEWPQPAGLGAWGMGMGGGMGGFGGGMGGMGAGGGGGGAPLFRSSVIPVAEGGPASTGISMGGDDEEELVADTEDALGRDNDVAQWEPPSFGPVAVGRAGNLGGGGAAQADFNSTVETITSTIAPYQWVDSGFRNTRLFHTGKPRRFSGSSAASRIRRV